MIKLHEGFSFLSFFLFSSRISAPPGLFASVDISGPRKLPSAFLAVWLFSLEEQHERAGAKVKQINGTSPENDCCGLL